MRHQRLVDGGPSRTVVFGRADNRTLRRQVCTRLVQTHRASEALSGAAAASLGRACGYRAPSDFSF